MQRVAERAAHVAPPPPTPTALVVPPRGSTATWARRRHVLPKYHKCEVPTRSASTCCGRGLLCTRPRSMPISSASIAPRHLRCVAPRRHCHLTFGTQPAPSVRLCSHALRLPVCTATSRNSATVTGRQHLWCSSRHGDGREGVRGGGRRGRKGVGGRGGTRGGRKRRVGLTWVRAAPPR